VRPSKFQIFTRSSKPSPPVATSWPFGEIATDCT
jgi:hypothetical protein